MIPRILHRYLLWECVKTWLAVVAVLLVLTLGIGFARFIARAAAGELSADAVLAVAGFSALENLEIVLPVSLLLAILLTVGRLCRDNEMTALAAGGVGLARLYQPFLLLAVLLATVAAWMSLVVAPEAGRVVDRLREQGGALALQALEPGRFHNLLDGRAVFYAAAEDPDGHMHGIFIRVAGDDGREETVVVAQTAQQRYDDESNRQTLVLENGWRYEGQPGRGDYRIIQFAEHGVSVAPPAAQLDLGLSETPTPVLLGRDDSEARAELQHRLAVPISVVMLALLALPLGYVPPRSGRYGRIVLGILLYVAYANLLRLGEVWVAQEQVPAALGLWWVHALVLAAALAMIARRQGRLRLPGVRAG